MNQNNAFLQSFTGFRARRFLLQSTLVVSFLLVGWLNADATDFYVSSAGNDAWDGMSKVHSGGNSGPWETLTKVNQQMAQLEGESVLFRRGDRFEGTLEVKQKNITFGAYGYGERPVLSGAVFVTGNWSPVKGRTNVYQYQVPSDVKDVAMLLRENISLPLGRTPNGNIMTNAGFYTFNNREQTKLYDPELRDAEKLGGSEIVLRKNVWDYSSYQVTTVEGTTVNFINNEKVPKKAGDQFLEATSYFFQKHLNTLDVDGEWFFDASKHILYVYADKKELTKSIQYSAKPVVINISNSEAIAFQGLRIEMAGYEGIQVATSQQVDVRDCEITLCGQDGISVEASSMRIENNDINNCLSAGIRTNGEGRVVVTRNNLLNIGLIAGRGESMCGMTLMGGNSEASYNRLTNIGYIGIRHAGGNNLLRRNIIDTYNLVVHDGGAIYTNHDAKGTIIEENIIRNGMANAIGCGDSTLNIHGGLCTGIQCDLWTNSIIIRNNTISFPKNTEGRFSGIHFNFNSMDNLVLGNTIIAKGAGISTNDRDPYERAPGEASPPSMSGNRFEENVIVSTSTSSGRIRSMANTAFSLVETEQCDVENQGLFINNVLASPFTGSKVIMEWQYNCNEGRMSSDDWFSTASDWNDAREYAIGNLDPPIMIDPSCVPEDFIQLFTNDSDNPISFPLTAGTFLDPWGKPVSGSVTIAPWRSVVLFKKQ
jgi:hypothetical protein